MEEKIITILNEICNTEDGDLAMDTNLFGIGLLDSFGVVQLLVALESVFNIALDIGELTREDIATPYLILQHIKQVQNQ